MRRKLSKRGAAGIVVFFNFIVIFMFIVFVNCASATGFIKAGERGGSGGTGFKIPDVALISEAVSVRFDNQMAKTRVVQIFKNNTPRILEGEYIFPLPFGANIVSFATWDDGVKINGVIMEKVKAKKIYEDIVSQMKDPGLLENIGSNTFCAKIFPIPAYGTKRLEMEYVEYMPLLNRLYTFTYPLYSEELDINARNLSIDVEIVSDFEVVSPQIYFKNIAFVKKSSKNYTASYAAQAFNDKVDFKAAFSLDMAASASKTLVYSDTYNGSEEIYFLTSLRPFDNETASPPAAEANNKNAVFLIDTSYSMRGEKNDIVKKIFSGIDQLDGYGNFNAIFFDSKVSVLAPDFIKADKAGFAKLQSRIDKIKPFGASRPLAAINELIKLVKKSDCAEVNAVLISDGLYQTSEGGRPLSKSLKSAFDSDDYIKKCLTISALAVGAGCENDRLTMVSNAFMGEFRELKNLYDNQAQLIIPSILKSMAGGIVKNISFKPSGTMNASLYPQYLQNVNFDSECYAVGRLNNKSDISLDLSYEFKGRGNAKKIFEPITEKPSQASYIALLWARQRVNYLTAYIDENGENEDMRKEIVELSKRFNFVTKYTSFLAVPPSVLRPRRIKPGDPEISVSAPRDSKLVLIKLPFAEPLKAEYDEKKGLFVARFTAPAHIKDGRYEARVMIVDKFNRENHHTLDFFIDSTPPALYAKCTPEIISAGGSFVITANASPDTVSIKAKMPGGEILVLKYDPLSKLSRAEGVIKRGAKPGTAQIEVEAIDQAGNRSVKFIKYTIAAESAALTGAGGNFENTAGVSDVK